MNNVRTCLGCRQRAATTSLLRLAALNGELVVDHSATLPGRGAWVHPSIECVDTAFTRKAFGRALRMPDIGVDRDALRTELTNQPTGASRSPHRTG